MEPIRPWCLEVFIENPLKCPLLWVLLSRGLSCAAQKWGLPLCPVCPMAAFLPCLTFLFPNDAACPSYQLLEALVISKGIICLHNSDKCVGDSHKDTVLCSCPSYGRESRHRFPCTSIWKLTLLPQETWKLGMLGLEHEMIDLTHPCSLLAALFQILAVLVHEDCKA